MKVDLNLMNIDLMVIQNREILDGIYNWQLKNQTNAIGAIHEGKLFAVGLFDSKVNSDVFHFWVDKFLLPELPSNSVIVMDNAAFHKRQDI